MHRETWQDCSAVLDHVKEQERRPHNILNMERIASIPTELMNQWASEGYPVFDPWVGDDVLLSLIRNGPYERLRTVADKGARS